MAGGSATAGERWGGGGGDIDLRLTKDEDTCARKKGGVVQLSTPSLGVGVHVHVPLTLQRLGAPLICESGDVTVVFSGLFFPCVKTSISWT